MKYQIIVWTGLILKRSDFTFGTWRKCSQGKKLFFISSKYTKSQLIAQTCLIVKHSDITTAMAEKVNKNKINSTSCILVLNINKTKVNLSR